MDLVTLARAQDRTDPAVDGPWNTLPRRICAEHWMSDIFQWSKTNFPAAKASLGTENEWRENLVQSDSGMGKSLCWAAAVQQVLFSFSQGCSGADDGRTNPDDVHRQTQENPNQGGERGQSSRGLAEKNSIQRWKWAAGLTPHPGNFTINKAGSDWKVKS